MALILEGVDKSSHIQNSKAFVDKIKMMYREIFKKYFFPEYSNITKTKNVCELYFFSF